MGRNLKNKRWTKVQSHRIVNNLNYIMLQLDITASEIENNVFHKNGYRVTDYRSGKAEFADHLLVLIARTYGFPTEWFFFDSFSRLYRAIELWKKNNFIIN